MGIFSGILKRKKKEEITRLTAEEAFALIKKAKEENTEKSLVEYFKANIVIAEKMKRTGQTAGLNRLRFLMTTVPKEAELIKRGYNKFVWKRRVDEVLDQSERDLKMIELEEFTRVLPDHVIQAVEDTNDLFTNYFVMYTDYTGKEERRIEQEERNRDPILWGAFIEEDKKTSDILFGERMYPIADWKDDYCDLTLDELCSEFDTADEKLVETITIDTMPAELEKRLNELSIAEASEVLTNEV